MKFFILLILAVNTVSPLKAAVLKSVGKGKGIVTLKEGESVVVGQTYFLLDFSGQAIGKVKIKKVNKDSAIVLISKSAKEKARIGYKVDTETSTESEFRAPMREEKTSARSSTFNRDFSSSFSLFSEGKVTGVLGAKLRHAMNPGSFLTAQIAKVGFKNEADNVQEGWEVLIGFGLPMSTQNFDSGFKFEAQIGYIATKLSFNDQFGSQFEASLSGTIFGAHSAYHWAFETFFIDLGLTLNYYMLDDQVPVETGHIEETPLSGVNLLFHLGVGLHF
jgi:hypothetical protein